MIGHTFLSYLMKQKECNMPRIHFKKPNRRIDRVFIHCTASDIDAHDSVEVIRKWHMDKGWSDIGYHFLIHKNGKISNGRNIENSPAAQHGHNRHTIAICLHGLRKENFSPKQYESLKQLCSKINKVYLRQVSFHGHCEVSNKSCPVINYKAILKLDRYGSLGVDVPTINSSSNEYPEINYRDKGEAVKRLQNLLDITEDGIYGKQTLMHVKAFKKQNRLRENGLVNKKIWLLLKKPILDNIVSINIDNLPDLHIGSRGKSVAFLQKLLFLKEDGIFGPNTAKAVKDFKKEHGYYSSDIVQRYLWKILLNTRKIEHYG